MKTIPALLICIPILSYPQGRIKTNQGSKRGEIIMLAGLALVAVTSTGLTHNERVDPALSKAIGMTGGVIMCIGMSIELNKNKRTKHRKHRIKLRIFS